MKKSKYLIMWCDRYQNWCITRRQLKPLYGLPKSIYTDPKWPRPKRSVLFSGGRVNWWDENRPIFVLKERFLYWLLCPHDLFMAIGRCSLLLLVVIILLTIIL